MLLKKPWWLKWVGRATLPEADATGYLVGWTKAWVVDDVPTPNGRIKAGLWTAAEFSGILPAAR